MKRVYKISLLLIALFMGFLMGKVDTIQNLQIVDGHHIEIRGEIYSYN